MAEIEAALAANRQHLAFEPPQLGCRAAERSAVSWRPDFPARAASRPARCAIIVLGVAGVSGRGERFVGGGKVVKNVTGYDIPKLMTGSSRHARRADGDHAESAARAGRHSHAAGARAARARRRARDDRSAAIRRRSFRRLSSAGGPRRAGQAAAEAATALRLEGVAPSVESRMASAQAAPAARGRARRARSRRVAGVLDGGA